MEKVKNFDWHRIFLGNENYYIYMLEIGFRILFIYAFAVLLMRFMGKRGNRSLSIFENVLIIALGSATGDAMFYPKVPLLYACLVISVIVAANRLLQYLQLKSKKFNTFLDGKPVLLVENGKLEKGGLRKSRVREEELFGMLRENGITNLNEVNLAYFERSGAISIKENEDRSKSNSLDLYAYIEQNK